MPIKILFEDLHLIVAVKPSGMPSQKDRSRMPDIFTCLKEQQGLDYLGLVHRLDRPVRGIMVFAKTPYSNEQLSKQIRQKELKKEYYAVVCGEPLEANGLLDNYLLKQSNNVSKVVEEGTLGSKRATLEYEKIDQIEDDQWGCLSLLRINLLTGRHHQIRVQMMHMGNPIWGDRKYNNHMGSPIALCAYRLSLKHPKTKKMISFEIKPEGFPFELFRGEGC